MRAGNPDELKRRFYVLAITFVVIVTILLSVFSY
jgi:hypothetical protein